jgi:NAD(P)-dependent dehydrogenase (short-subunit alcohol dehydrogenase family)/acyl carrier protein
LEPFAGDQSSLCGVVHLWCLDAKGSLRSAESGLNAALEISCRSALYLTQALVRGGGRSAPALWLVTRGAITIEVGQSVERGCEPGRLAASSLWGLGKVISQEHPELRCSLLDLDASSDERDPRRLLDEIYHRGPSVEDQIAYQAGYRHLARLKRSRATIRPQAAVVHPDRTYLITGGRGEIGLRVARWLADQGARNLVLIGRTSGAPEAQGTVNDLERTGVRIVAARADISRMQAVADVLEDIKMRMPPLAGVVHAAGVLEDRLIADHQWDLFEKSFAPKVHGAWNLHVLTREIPLDFFVLFSSAATLVGGSGLGNYVAANRFLDALAEHRRAVGLPGLSVGWGPWAGVGMANVVGRVREAQWSEIGLHPLSPARALEAMQHALQLDAAHVAVMSMDWRKFQGRWSSQRISRFFADVLQTSQPAPHQQAAFRQQIECAAAADRRPLLMAYVRAQVEETLGWGGEEHVQVKQGFFDLGMDSLRAVELRNRLQSGLACTLPATLTIKYPTIESLVEYLLNDALNFESARCQGGGKLRDQVSLPVVAPIVPKKVSNSSVLNELERLEDVLRRT